jgi:hypothetical protein
MEFPSCRGVRAMACMLFSFLSRQLASYALFRLRHSRIFGPRRTGPTLARLAAGHSIAIHFQPNRNRYSIRFPAISAAKPHPLSNTAPAPEQLWPPFSKSTCCHACTTRRLRFLC